MHDHTWQQQCIVMLENYQNEEEQKNMTTVKNYEEEKSYIATVHCNVRRVKKKKQDIKTNTENNLYSICFYCLSLTLPFH